MSTFEKLYSEGKITILGDKFILWVSGKDIVEGSFGLVLTEDQEIALRENEED